MKEENQEHQFAQSLKAFRTAVELTQEDLAKALGVSFMTVSRWETGRSKPSRLASEKLNVFCSRLVRQGHQQAKLLVSTLPRERTKQ